MMMGLARRAARALLLAAVAALDPAVEEVGVLNGGRHSRQEVANEGSHGDLAKELSEVLGTENRIGFRHCGLSIGSEDGSDSTVVHSLDRIAKVAGILHSYPDLRVMIEGHVHTSAPPEIAQAYSEYRANFIAAILEEEHGICPGRVETRGWGLHAAQAALSSEHPNARSAQAGYGWVEIFVLVPVGHCQHVFPPVPDYYLAAMASIAGEAQRPVELDAPETVSASAPSLGTPETALGTPPPPAPRSQPTSHPIFFMQPGAQVGEPVALHLFEPRYMLLAQRVWATDKMFIYCADTKVAWSDHVDQDACVVVRMQSANFSPNGEADILGTATAPFRLHHASIEPGTGGLFSTNDPLPHTAEEGAVKNPHPPRHPAPNLLARPVPMFFVAVALYVLFCKSKRKQRAQAAPMSPLPGKIVAGKVVPISAVPGKIVIVK